MISALKKNKAEKEVRVMEVGAASLMKQKAFLFLRQVFLFFKENVKRGLNMCHLISAYKRIEKLPLSYSNLYFIYLLPISCFQ